MMTTEFSPTQMKSLARDDVKNFLAWFSSRQFELILQWFDLFGDFSFLSEQQKLVLLNSLIVMDDREQAAELGLKLMDLFPSNHQIQLQTLNLLVARGLRRLKENRTNQAQVDFVKAIQIEPKKNDARLELACLKLEDINQIESAKQDFNEILRRDPNNEKAKNWLALIEKKSSDEISNIEELLTQGYFALAGQRAQNLTEKLDDETVSGWVRLLARNAQPHQIISAPRLQKSVETRVRTTLAANLALPFVYQSESHLRAEREKFEIGLNTICFELQAEKLASRKIELEQLLWSNFLLAYQGSDDLSLQSKYGDWLVSVLQAIRPKWSKPIAPRSGVRNRIGLVSSFWRDCSVGSYFGEWILALTKAGFETHVVQLGPVFDPVTDALEKYANRLHRVDQSLEQCAGFISDLKCDVLIYPELGMDARCLVLAGLRLAAKQVCAWGHPVTSGLSTIDFYLTCELMEPANANAQYRESVLHLPGLGTRYQSPALPRRVELNTSLPLGRRYLVPQSAFKIHPANDKIFATIAALDWSARLIFFNAETEHISRQLRARLRNEFLKCGANPDRQLVFIEPVSREQYLKINSACDLMIDTRHWSGGNTSIDALFSGLPIVTSYGTTMRSRQSAAMISLIGLQQELVCSDSETIAKTAFSIAQDVNFRNSLSQQIFEKFSQLTYSQAPLDALVQHLRNIID